MSPRQRLASQDERLRRADRVRSRRDYLRLRASSDRRQNAHFVLLSGEPWEPGCCRLGLTVSRRVGSAVVRNSVKRRIREWFRRSELRRGRARDWVVIARPAAADLSSEAIRRSLEELAR